MGYKWPKRKAPIRRSKFNVDPELNRLAGTPRGSKLERAVHGLLKLREAAGEIRDIRQQVRVDMGFGIYWNCDFSFDRIVSRDRGGAISETRRVWCEAKGVVSARYRIIEKLWKGGQGPGGDLEVWGGRYDNPRLLRIVCGRRKKETV